VNGPDLSSPALFTRMSTARTTSDSVEKLAESALYGEDQWDMPAIELIGKSA